MLTSSPGPALSLPWVWETDVSFSGHIRAAHRDILHTLWRTWQGHTKHSMVTWQGHTTHSLVDSTRTHYTLNGGLEKDTLHTIWLTLQGHTTDSLVDLKRTQTTWHCTDTEGDVADRCKAVPDKQLWESKWRRGVAIYTTPLLYTFSWGRREYIFPRKCHKYDATFDRVDLSS